MKHTSGVGGSLEASGCQVLIDQSLQRFERADAARVFAGDFRCGPRKGLRMGVPFVSGEPRFRHDRLRQRFSVVNDGRWRDGGGWAGSVLAAAERPPECQTSQHGSGGSSRNSCDPQPRRDRHGFLSDLHDSVESIRWRAGGRRRRFANRLRVWRGLRSLLNRWGNGWFGECR